MPRGQSFSKEWHKIGLLGVLFGAGTEAQRPENVHAWGSWHAGREGAGLGLVKVLMPGCTAGVIRQELCPTLAPLPAWLTHPPAPEGVQAWIHKPSQASKHPPWGFHGPLISLAMRTV